MAAELPVARGRRDPRPEKERNIGISYGTYQRTTLASTTAATRATHRGRRARRVGLRVGSSLDEPT